MPDEPRGWRERGREDFEMAYPSLSRAYRPSVASDSDLARDLKGS